jgi:hypothetical protein
VVDKLLAAGAVLHAQTKRHRSTVSFRWTWSPAFGRHPVPLESADHLGKLAASILARRPISRAIDPATIDCNGWCVGPLRSILERNACVSCCTRACSSSRDPDPRWPRPPVRRGTITPWFRLRYIRRRLCILLERCIASTDFSRYGIGTAGLRLFKQPAISPFRQRLLRFGTVSWGIPCWWAKCKTT